MAEEEVMEDISTLRELIFDFYAENDPSKLRSGLDVNGMAEWTIKNGIESLNELLNLQYGKGLDTRKKLGSVQEQVSKFSKIFSQARKNQLSQGEVSSNNTASTQNDENVFISQQKQKEEIAEKIEKFYSEHDPSKLNDIQVDALVNAAMIHGIQRVNKDLLDRYGTDLDGNRVGDELDELKVRQELRIFYQKHDPAYLDRPENLDKVIGLMYNIGQKAVYSKLFKYYGEKVENAVLEHQQQKVSQSSHAERSTLTKTNSFLKDTTEADSQVDDDRVLKNYISAFDDVDKFRTDLIRYYKKHDPEEIENIDDVIELGMDVGIEKLNESMRTFYGESLKEFLKNEKRKNSNSGNEENKLLRYSRFKNAPRSSKLRKEVNLSQFQTLINEKSNTNKYKSPQKASPGMPKKGTKEEDIGVKIEPPKKETEDDFIKLKKDLVLFYTKYDKPKLECLDQIIKLGKTLGREELNLKLVGFYGVGLDSIEEKVTSKSGQKMDSKDSRKIKNFFGNMFKSPPKRNEISMLADDFLNEELPTVENDKPNGVKTHRSIFSTSLKPLRRKKNILNKRTSGNDYSSKSSAKNQDQSYLVDQVDYNDLTKLRGDLFLYYEKFDEEKFNVIDQIVQLAKRIGRKKLDSKLQELYGTGLDEYIRSLENQRKTGHKHGKRGSTSQGNSLHKLPRRRNVKTATLKLLSIHVENASEIAETSMSKQIRGRNSRNPPKEKVSVNELFQEADLASFYESEENLVDGPCQDYNLDMDGNMFGVCTCGHTKEQHSQDHNEEDSVSF